MSAMLTYFSLIVTRQGLAAKGKNRNSRGSLPDKDMRDQEHHVRHSVRSARRVYLVQRQDRALGGREAPRTVARPSLRILRVRGRAGLWRDDLQVHGAFRALPPLGRNPRFQDPVLGRRARRRQGARGVQERLPELLCPAGGVARQRDDGRRGAELDHPCRHRDLGLAVHVRRRAEDAAASASISPIIAVPTR